jgi:hypothetical protein
MFLPQLNRILTYSGFLCGVRSFEMDIPELSIGSTLKGQDVQEEGEYLDP